MAIHWQIPFKSLLSGTDYTVNVYDSTFTGTPVVLKGGANPFTTEENDDEDPFTPVRTQSGYITIIDDGFGADGVTPFNWLDIMPETETSRPITLTANGQVLFVGYIQAENFTGVLYGGVQERRIPVQCVLSVLQGLDFASNHTDMLNFATLIQYILNAANHPVAFTDFYFHGSTARLLLSALTDPQLFLEEDDGDLVPSRSCGELLEDICSYLGWTCHTQGTTVFFCRCDAAVGDGILHLTAAQLAEIAAGKSAGTTSLIPNPSVLQGDIFLSADNEDMALRGYGKVVIHADADPLDDEVIECWPDSAVKDMRKGGWGDPITVDDATIRYTTDITSIDTPLFIGSASNDAYASFNVGYLEESAAEFLNLIRIKRSYIASADPYVQLDSRYAHDYDRCKLSLSGSAYKQTEKLSHPNKRGVGRYYMTMRLGIGTSRSTAKWLHLDTSIGYEWADSPYNFYVSLGNQGDDLYFVSSYNDKGYANGVVLKDVSTTGSTTGLTGRIYIDLLGSDRMLQRGLSPEYWHAFDLRDFTVKISNETLEDTPYADTTLFPSESVDEKEYSAVNGSGFTDTYDIDTIFCSYPYATFGRGRIWLPRADLEPEQTLADRIANFWHVRRRLLRPVIRASAIPDDVLNKILVLDGCRTCVNSIKRDWWNDEVTLMLIGNKS